MNNIKVAIFKAIHKGIDAYEINSNETIKIYR